MTKGSNVQPEVMWPQQKCVAVLAAISNKRGLLHFYFREKSIKSDDYIDFLMDLRHMTPDQPLNILLDNCQVHKSRVSMAASKELGVNLIFNQPYKPEFNGIELFWAQCKHKFKKAALSILTGESSETCIRKIVAPILKSIP